MWSPAPESVQSKDTFLASAIRMGWGWRASFPGKFQPGTHLQLVSHMEVSADPLSPRHQSGLSTAPSGCGCPSQDPPFSIPGLPSFTPEDQRWGLMPAWSWECPAVGSAEVAGRTAGHGSRRSPTAPAITGRLWNGENSHQRDCQIFPCLMDPLSSLTLAALPQLWDAHACTQAGPLPPSSSHSPC